jgi:hypothetical protein
MNSEVEKFADRFEHALREYRRLFYMTRGKEFQLQAYEDLDSFKAEIDKAKEGAISATDEDSANALLGFQEAIEAMKCELMMWIKLKEDDPNSAWDYLVDAQMDVSNAIDAHQMFEKFTSCTQRLDVLEKTLFPPQTYLSTGSVVSKLECSICGKEAGECDHLPGKPYMGRLCHRIVRGLKFREISIVQEPGSKHHRVTAISDGKDWRDVMTGRVEQHEPKT